MALNTDPTYPPAGFPNTGPYLIDKEWCMGDSLNVINANFDIYDQRTLSLSSQLIDLRTDLTTLSSTTVACCSAGGGGGGGGGPVTLPRISGLIDQTLGGGNTNTNVFIVSDGTLRVVGQSSKGELGIGNDTSSTSVPRIPLFDEPLFDGEKIASVVPQGDVIYVLTTFGRLYGAGFNTQYQLGVGDAINRYVFTRIYLEGSGTVDIPAPKPANLFVKKIIPGSGGLSTSITVFALTSNGDVWVWGYQKTGFIPMPAIPTAVGIANVNYIFKPVLCTTINGVKDIVSGGNNTIQTTFFHKTNNTLWVCGENSLGCAGVGTTLAAAPHLVPLYGDIKNKVVQVLVPGISNNVKKIYCGGEGAGKITSWIITDTGKVYGTGYNNVGQAIAAIPAGATGTKINIFTEITHFTTNAHDVESLSVHSDTLETTVIALIKTATPGAYTLKGWGSNKYGALGISNNTTPILTPTAPTSPWSTLGNFVKEVCVAGNDAKKATLVLDTSGKLWSTGFGDYGLLGNGLIGSSSRRNVFKRVSISSGYGIPVLIRSTNTSFGDKSNFLALLDNGKVLGWGFDSAATSQLAIDPTGKSASIPSYVLNML